MSCTSTGHRNHVQQVSFRWLEHCRSWTKEFTFNRLVTYGMTDRPSADSSLPDYSLVWGLTSWKIIL